MKYIMRHVKSIFYTLIILFLCIVDQRRGSAPGQVQFVFVNLAGAAVCLLMFSAYKLKEFLRFPYWIWTIVFAVGSIAVTHIRDEAIIYRGQWYTALINVWLIGLLVIKMISKIFAEKYRPSFSKKALVLFLGFMLLACLSKNDSLWTWWYLVLFTMLYLTDFSSEDRQRLFNAIPNGITLGFFLIQGLAFVFRPYDNLRYHGLYANENMNALFYSLVYCAFLSKYCRCFGRNDEIKRYRLRRIILMYFCGVMWSFVCMTMCRTAMISMAIVTGCAVIYCLCKIKKKIIVNVASMVAGLIISIILSAPITYCAVRYLPAVFHHPIWFGGEYSSEDVHSWDPIDSPKYIKWEQIWEGLLGRWRAMNISELIVKDETNNIICIVSNDSDRIMAKMVLGYIEQQNNYEMSKANVRLEIFKYYYEQLNVWGHLNAESGFLLREITWVPHAHNLILEMAFMFGIPSAVFCVIWLVYGISVSVEKAFCRTKDDDMMMLALFYINIVTFGMLEIVWLTGQISFILLFIMPVFIFNETRKKLVLK